MLKKLREHIFINRIVRNVIICFGYINRKLYLYTSARWPVSGVVKLKANNKDFKMYAKCDDGIVNAFFYKKNYIEEEDLNFFLILAKKSQIILDVGANTGLYALLSSLTNPSADVYAFEPYEYNFERLKKNFQLNNLHNITLVKAAIGDSECEIDFTVPTKEMIIDVASANNEFSKYFYKEKVGWKIIKVKQVSLDFYLANELGDKKIDLLKIDVESYEMNVFKGMFSILMNHRPKIVFESFIDDQRREFFRDILLTFKYYGYCISRKGLVRLKNGFEPNKEGLNYFLSPFDLKRDFISYDEVYDVLFS